MPPAAAVAPLSFAESCTLSPCEPADSESVVPIDGLFGAITSCSSVQALVAPLLWLSPE